MTTEKRKAQNRESSTTYIKRHIELGLCVQCSRPALPGYRVCEVHLLKNRERMNIIDRRPEKKKYKIEYSKKLRAKRKADGRCTNCGAPLDGDTGFLQCINCRLKMHAHIGQPKIGNAYAAANG